MQNSSRPYFKKSSHMRQQKMKIEAFRRVACSLSFAQHSQPTLTEDTLAIYETFHTTILLLNHLTHHNLKQMLSKICKISEKYFKPAMIQLKVLVCNPHILG